MSSLSDKHRGYILEAPQGRKRKRDDPENEQREEHVQRRSPLGMKHWTHSTPAFG